MTRHIIAAAVLSLAAALPAAAQTKDAAPRPPYLVTQSEHLIVVFEADEAALKSLLPPGVKPAAGNAVGLNMYRTQQVVGLAPYTASYLWINVDGFDSPEGTKGRWMAQGWYGPELVTSAIRGAGFPVQLGATRYERDGNRIHAVLTSEGVDLIDATIELKDGKLAPAAGMFNYPVSGRNLAGASASSPAIAVNRIPFSGEVAAATPVSVAFHFRDKDAARVLQPKRLIDALYVKGTAFTLGVVDLNPPELVVAK